MLHLLALTACALLLVGVAGLVAARPWLPVCLSAVCGVGLAVTLVALATGAAGSLALPFGLPGQGGARLTLALDGLSAAFLLPVFAAGAAAGLHAGRALDGMRLMPVLLAGFVLAVLAADGPALVLGLGAAALAAWALVLGGGRTAAAPAASLGLGLGLAATLCLAGAFALLAPVDAGGDAGWAAGFAAMRVAPPEGWRATAVLGLTVLGTGGLAGLVPLHAGALSAYPASPAGTGAILSAAGASTAIYVLARVLFDLCGTATPAWWGLFLLALGTASALLGALRANLEADLDTVLAAGAVENAGVAVAGLGAALVARGADLPSLAALAAAGVVAGVLGQAGARLVLVLAAGSMLDGAGTRRLDRLGGLMHRMPATACCVLVGALGLSALPLGAGFAGRWLLVQALMASPRTGTLAAQVGFAAAAVLIALAAALMTASMLRLVGIGLLGRPRSPRAAAAEEAPRPARHALWGVAAACALAGLLPGPLLALMDGAVRVLAGAGLDGRAGWWLLRPAADAAGVMAPGYSAPGIAVLAGGLGWLGWRLLGGRAARRTPAWEGGFSAPPPWLPFGDPLTQYGAMSLAQPLARALGPSLLSVQETVDPAPPGAGRYALSWRDPVRLLRAPWLDRGWTALSGRLDRLPPLTIRHGLLLMLVALVLVLVAVAWLGAR